jgi:hypothetical protein
MNPLFPMTGMFICIFLGILLLMEIFCPKFKKSFFNLTFVAAASAFATLVLVFFAKTLD